MLSGEPGLLISYMLLVALNTLPFFTHIPPNFQVLIQTPVIVYIGSIHSLRLYGKTIDVEAEGVETMTKKRRFNVPYYWFLYFGRTFFGFYLFE